MLDSFLLLLKDIFYRFLGKQRCALFSNQYVELYMIDQYRDIFEQNYMLTKTTPDGFVTFANKKFLESYGLTERCIVGKSQELIRCNNMTEEQFDIMWDRIKKNQIWTGVLPYDTADGTTRWNVINVFPIVGKNGKIKEYVVLRSDITKVIELEHQMESEQSEMLITLGGLVESKDGDLRDHIERVSEYSYVLGKGFGLTDTECNLLKKASPMHDVGKIGIPDEILNAPRKLSDEEFEKMKEHTTIGWNIFKGSKMGLLQVASKIAHEHHEKWDGTGYPLGLKGEQISIYGRITALADVIDALSIRRVYKEPWTLDQIEEYLIENKGKIFDPNLVDVYFRNRDKFIEIMKKHYD